MNKYTPRQRCAQEYMRSILRAERRIQVLQSEIERQQERLTLNGVAGGESVSRTMAGDAHERGFVELYALCDRLDTELCGYVEERDEGLRALSMLGDQELYDVLFLRYFEGMTFASVARCMRVSERLAYDLHAAALTEVYRFVPREFRQRRAGLQILQ